MNTRPTFTPGELIPAQMGDFNHHSHRADARSKARGWSKVEPLPKEFDAKSLVAPTAVAAIRKAFTLAKTSHEGWKIAQRTGRIDSRRMIAATRRDQDIFKRKAGRSTTRVKCAVLIDDSGSMSGNNAAIPVNGRDVRVTKKMAAAVFGATICTALGAVPTVDLDVFYHSASAGRMYLKWRWHRGTPVQVFNGAAINNTPGGTNADGHAIHAMADRIQKTIRHGEHGVILVVSDGLPSAYSRDGQGDAGQALTDAVSAARAAGIVVIGVAIDGADQTAYYGDGYLPFSGDWTALGKSLGVTLGKSLASAR